MNEVLAAAACLVVWFDIGYATYRLALHNADEDEIEEVVEGMTVFVVLGPVLITVVGVLCLIEWVREKVAK